MSRFAVRDEGRGQDRAFRVMDTQRTPPVEVAHFRGAQGARNFADKLNREWERYVAARAGLGTPHSKGAHAHA